MSISISINYDEIKALLRDFRKLWRRVRKQTSENPEKCERCKEFKFCGSGLGFLTSIGGLDQRKIRILKKDNEIMTLDLVEIPKDAVRFLSREAYTDFHSTLHDYAESTNYVAVLNHILGQMSLLETWLKEVEARAKDSREASIAMLQQIIEFLPMIYVTRKDPYQGGFRKTKLAQRFFIEEMPQLLGESIDLLQLKSMGRFRKRTDQIVQKINDVRGVLMSDYRIALDSSLETGQKLRGYFGKNKQIHM